MTEFSINWLLTEFLRLLKRKWFADIRLAKLVGVSEAKIRKLRHKYKLYFVLNELILVR
ncbi:MAG: hypothetical protein ACTS73_04690 [Arsenophonus sp. NEOnobi-MAG3]